MKLSENKLRGIFWGGLTGGLGSCLPVVGLVNCVCCLWAWIAGAMTVALIRGRESLDDRDAPKTGAIAGAFAGLVSATGQLLYSIMAGPSTTSFLGEIKRYLPDTFPEQSLEAFEGMASSGITAAIFHFISGMAMIAIFSVFGALGALLYVRFTGRKPAASPEPGDVETAGQQ